MKQKLTVSKKPKSRALTVLVITRENVWMHWDRRSEKWLWTSASQFVAALHLNEPQKMSERIPWHQNHRDHQDFRQKPQIWANSQLIACTMSTRRKACFGIPNAREENFQRSCVQKWVALEMRQRTTQLKLFRNWGIREVVPVLRLQCNGRI